ncbi:hypothetical protein BC936DRAFT_144702 [Jimgerdemannia flammicorona]|uniref:Uncharacterized protein n=1 Tax=Jimgerdemannia flammicorona TaxID=994334 RepID=A0A433DBY1_9FUNG|nr:hypothetical protein BC936DRAFT_144702 [Jimgerdemannia flammicorona]
MQAEMVTVGAADTFKWRVTWEGPLHTTPHRKWLLDLVFMRWPQDSERQDLNLGDTNAECAGIKLLLRPTYDLHHAVFIVVLKKEAVPRPI